MQEPPRLACETHAQTGLHRFSCLLVVGGVSVGQRLRQWRAQRVDVRAVRTHPAAIASAQPAHAHLPHPRGRFKRLRCTSRGAGSTGRRAGTIFVEGEGVSHRLAQATLVAALEHHPDVQLGAAASSTGATLAHNTIVIRFVYCERVWVWVWLTPCREHRPGHGSSGSTSAGSACEAGVGAWARVRATTSTWLSLITAASACCCWKCSSLITMAVPYEEACRTLKVMFPQARLFSSARPTPRCSLHRQTLQQAWPHSRDGSQ
jgi:hypothetical protein